MEFQVSARKWRPQRFEEVVGQSHVAQTLKNAIRQDRIAHAYLFSGMRGVGKTTMARILAKAVNCQAADQGPPVAPCQTCASCRLITAGQSPDVIEIDGASNRGIDEVRELREMVKYAPMGGRYKIYIIDEVHMLTKEAFNALLKTLEEPPPHVIFVFATTEDHKIPSTILSRCQHFQFKRITRQATVAHLNRILQEEGIRFTPQGLGLIARCADGSLRDALSLLDQAVAYAGKEVADRDLQVILGTAGRDPVIALLTAILDRDTAGALRRVKEVNDQGLDPRQFTMDLAEYFRHLLVAKVAGSADELIDLPPEEIEEIRRLGSGAGVEELQRLYGIFQVALDSFRGAVHSGFVLEMAVIRATQIRPLESFEKLLERLKQLEGSLVGLEAGRFPGREGLKGRPEPPKEELFPEATPSSPGPRKGEIFPEKRNPADDPEMSSVPSSNPPETGIVGTETEGGEPDDGAAGLEERWTEVLKRILHDRPNLASYLEKGRLKPWTARDGRDAVVLAYDEGSAFLADRIQKDEARAAIESVIREVFGRPVGLKIIQMERSVEEREPQKQKKNLQAEKNRARVRHEAMSHPLVKDALNILGGDVIDVRET